MEKGVVVEYILSLIKENIKLLEEELDSIKNEKNILIKIIAVYKNEKTKDIIHNKK